MRITKIILSTALIVSITLWATQINCSASGSVYGDVASVLGRDASSTAKNPALLPLVESSLINATFAASGLALEGDSIRSFLVQGIIPLSAKIALGLSGFSSFNTIDGARGSSELLYAKWKANAGIGFSVNRHFQLGLSGYFKGQYVNEIYLLKDNFLENTAALKANVTLGVNYELSKVLNISFTAGNMVGYFVDKTMIDEDPGYIRAGVGLHIGKVDFGSTIDFSLFVRKFTYDLAGKIQLLNKKIRVLAGVEINNYKDGFVPRIGLGATLDFFLIDYAFSYPVSGLYSAGIHVVSIGWDGFGKIND